MLNDIDIELNWSDVKGMKINFKKLLLFNDPHVVPNTFDVF